MTTSDELGKTALRIYLFLLDSKEPLGVREIARSLDLPVSTVHYHLKRLEELGVVKQKSGGYIVAKLIQVEGFVLIGRRLVPRFIIYSLFYLGVLIAQVYFALSKNTVTPEGALSLLISLTSFLIFLIEGFLIKRKLRV